MNHLVIFGYPWRVLVQSPEAEAHDRVLDNNPDEIGIWKCWFLKRG